LHWLCMRARYQMIKFTELRAESVSRRLEKSLVGI
jgi:hypothetical protein